MSDAKTDAPPKKSKKLVIILAATLLLAGGGAGAAWYVFKPGASAEDQEEAEVRADPGAKPLYTQLEPFTVNLQDDRGERYAQIGITLQYTNPKIDATLQDHLPALRNDVLLLISAKQIQELLTPQGKSELAEQIRTIAGKSVGWEPAEDEDEDEAKADKKKKRRKKAPENPVDAVLFSSFIVQ